MTEFFKFIFSDFWYFIGFIIVLGTVGKIMIYLIHGYKDDED